MLKLQVRDFKVVENANIAVKGFTLLKGESGAGKSSIISALFNATQNRFSSRNVRNGTEFATIRLGWSDKEEILGVRRSVSGGSPVMKLGQNTWSKLRRQVPTEVEEYNNFGILTVGAEKYYLNFYEQFQKPLLKEFSQRRVMEILSASQAMDEHSMIHYSLLKEREQNRGAINNLDAVISQQKAKLSQIKFEVAEKEIIVNQMNEAKEKTLALISRRDYITQLIQEYDSLIQSVSDSKAIATNIKRLAEISELSKQRELLNRKRELVGTLLSTMRTTSMNIRNSRAVVNSQNLLSEILTHVTTKTEVQNKSRDLSLVSQLILQNETALKESNRYSALIKTATELDKRYTLFNETSRSISRLEALKKELNNLDKLTHALEETGPKIHVLRTIQKQYTLRKDLIDRGNLVTELLREMSAYKENVTRLSEVDNIIKNNLCPTCGTKLTNH